MRLPGNVQLRDIAELQTLELACSRCTQCCLRLRLAVRGRKNFRLLGLREGGGNATRRASATSDAENTALTRACIVLKDTPRRCVSQMTYARPETLGRR